MQRAEQEQTNWKAPFFAIWTGQAFSLIGSQVAGFALVWWLTETTGSATVLATATMVTLLPGILLGPFAGALVDRWNRRQVMIVADAFIALVSAWLVYLFWSGTMQVWHIYPVMLARAFGGTFHWPAMQASTSLMVPKEHLARVAGLNQTIQGALSILAPPLGALLLELLPLQGIMGIDVVTALLAIAPLCFVEIPQPSRRVDASGEEWWYSLWEDVREGLGYMWRAKGMRVLMLMAMAINFLIHPAMALMPLLVTEHFGGGPLELGWLNAGWGAGVVLGGLILSIWGGFRRRVATSLSGLTLMGVGFILTGSAPAWAFWLGLLGLSFAGLMNPITNGPVFAVMQATVAPEMQGRIFTLLGSLAGAMAPIGLAIAGPLSDALGVRIWFVIGGIACTVLGVVGFFTPSLLYLEDDIHLSRPPGTDAAFSQTPSET